MDKTHDQYDVVIVGAGPAGIFAALELVRRNGVRVAIIEGGPDIDHRVCPARTTGVCTGCSPCGITCGWGGAGAFSDGKLTLASEVGGWLDEYVSPAALRDLIAYVDGIWVEFGAPPEVHGGGAEADVIRLQASAHGLTLVDSPVRHMGTEHSYHVLTRLRGELDERVTVRTGTLCTRILTQDGAHGRPFVSGVVLAEGRQIGARCVIVAPGRQGAGWLVGECRRLGIALHTNPVDIGTRVEVNARVMDALTAALYESKLLYTTPTFGDAVRTFCMNPHGRVSLENYGDVVTVNGHSYARDKTDRTNFALLVSTRFTEPFNEPIAYGKSIARLANLLGDQIIVQRLGDLRAGRRSTRERLVAGSVQPSLEGATAGDLAFVLPYRHLRDILEMLEALEHLAPGVNGPDTLLYGVEVKFYSARLELDEGLQTPVQNLYAVGDGAGLTRGLIQASAAGVIAARSILNGGRSVV